MRCQSGFISYSDKGLQSLVLKKNQGYSHQKGKQFKGGYYDISLKIKINYRTSTDTGKGSQFF